MKLIKTTTQLRRHIAQIKARKQTVGFVPTMGALHAGHLRLIAAARRRADRVVVSIFVNPTQFGPSEGYRRYPRTLKQDLAACRTQGVDLVFAPSVEELYPEGATSHVTVGPLGAVLEGVSRPGHFDGVATVVLKLLQLVQPDQLYLGRKDYQQALIIRQLIRDFFFRTVLIVCPTIREPDGLALSSRNRYLTRRQRSAAPLLYRALLAGRKRLQKGTWSAQDVRAAMRRVLRKEPLINVDYLVVCDPATLAPSTRINRRCLLAVAAHLGSTRLIDNIILRKPSSN